MSTVFILEDDRIMASCISAAVQKAGKNLEIKHFSDAISAVQSLGDQLPSLILLDVLLDGPDGFTFLNELASYDDTNKIPIIIISSLDLKGQDLSAYNVIAVLDKETMRPADITALAEKILA